MAKKIPEHIAFQLAQKTKEQARKLKEAEKKIKEAEKKIKEADKKAKEADKKAKEAEQEDDSEIDLDVLDELDDLDDFDDFDDFDEIEEEDVEDAEEVVEEVSEAEVDIPPSEESGDDELDALLKQAKGPVFESKVERANRLSEEGDFNAALEIWKELTASDGNDPANWRGLASVLESRNDPGDSDKAKTAKDHADRLETQAIADATGRKMEDIIADLLDDGILNFSAGSDAKDLANSDDSDDDDDLTKLPGIGNVGQQKLNYAGIDTFEQLSERSDEEIAEILDAKKVESWSGMARMLAKEKKQ
tara:strand:+ start:677 stop:1591 length:915 start_codon:yes stop_codon:yes gene_type:complete